MTITILIALGSAAVLFLLFMGIGALLRSRRDEAEGRVKQRLRQFALTEVESDSIDLILKQTAMSTMPWFNRALKKLRFAANLEETIKQANAKGSAGVYLLVCALLGLIGIYIGIIFAQNLMVAVALAGVCGIMPILYLQKLRTSRMDRFQTQLPEALDLMSRALKAGHTFGGAMRMVADEFEDPIGSEFRTTIDEINFGMDVDRAMANLQNRVDVTDLKFFIVSINIQRETGGNLAEIISNIASLVRERFVLFGKIKVLSAEGRISAILLASLPFFISGALYMLNPEYMSRLWTTELGRTMTWGAIIAMSVGIVVMRKMVKIKV
ncbi:type II secretion system F family protein [Pseudodesulfovibrio piezophilus]|uniref:Type II secretion system protein n=1 Tax=Pseudodesulfovibrio piezophilus (strain DSM 21447 / JCM 15486 / C1TLV30) TaxID=1322246 RepID=M1WJY5_PSEP2|nr:type II secretion system F family protein [Pseudodesulfovibrio piezophilus]CCH48696.1 Type II secretion system protein [Pseudodesulfovibrio piezophilus C1TLV30]